MKYNFDEIIERRGTNSVKWDGVKNIWGRDDLLPMWVADMDFKVAPEISDEIIFSHFYDEPYEIKSIKRED